MPAGDQKVADFSPARVTIEVHPLVTAPLVVGGGVVRAR